MAGKLAEYGTARRIGFDPNEPIFGKTEPALMKALTYTPRVVRIVLGD